MTCMATPLHKNLMKFTILVDPSFVIIIIYPVLNLSDLCPVYRRSKEIYFHYMAMPQHKNPCSRGHEIYNFGSLYLEHHYYIYLVCLIYAKV